MSDAPAKLGESRGMKMVPAGPCSQVVRRPAKVRSAVADQVLKITPGAVTHPCWFPGCKCKDYRPQKQVPKPQVRHSVQDAIELVQGRTPRALLQLRSRVHCGG